MLSMQQPGAQGAFPNYSDLLAAIKGMQPAVSSLSSSGTTDTLAASSIVSGIYVRSGATAAVAATTDTAANIVSALGPNAWVGQTFLLFYVNLNTTSGAVTVSAGTGVTLTGTNTVPVAGLRCYVGTVTNVTSGSQAVTMQGAWSIGSGVAA